MKQKKKILITIDWFLPGTDSGGPVRSYANLIAHLGSDFDFYIITRDTDYCSTTPYTDIQSNAWNDLQGLAHVYYVSSDFLNITHLSALFKTQSFDVIYINGIYSWCFSILPLLIFRHHPHCIIAARGMLNPQAFSIKPFRKRIYLKIAKFLGVYSGKHFHATNTLEADYVRNIMGTHVPIHIAPNLPRLIPEAYFERSKSDDTRFVNVARVSVEKGTLKMLEAFKYVTDHVHLDIYGPIYDDAYWMVCQKAIAELPDHIIVRYKGIAKSDTIPSILKRYDYFIMLSEGENFGHAILEALSSGLPVVISNKTPWTSLQEKQIGWDLCTTHLERVGAVLQDASTLNETDYKTMSKSAYQYAKDFINDPLLITANKDLFL